MTKTVTLVDYGIGNIFNVRRAFEYCNAKVVMTHQPDDIVNATSLVLPGVGAFSMGMQGLAAHDLIGPIQQYAASGKPLLGICLGMQLLFDESHEFGLHKGLGIINGHIRPIKPVNQAGQLLKVPHIGWSRFSTPDTVALNPEPLFDYVRGEMSCYFVHSYAAFPENDAHRLADTVYGDFLISAIVKKNNVYGCQFHPEKSGPTGLKILQGFLNC